ncbi:MAG: hypothetical protein Q9167_007345 [Letrouitia subvulpina]
MSPIAPSKDPNLHFEGPSTQDEQFIDIDTIETTMEPTPSTVNMLEEQRKDIEAIMGIVNGLSKDMKAVKESIEKIKAEQQRSTKDTEVTTATPASNTSIIEDIEILTENVSELTRKANVADELKLELQGMKRRLQRLENAKSSSRLATSTSARQVSKEALENADDNSPSIASNAVSAIEEREISKRKSIHSNSQGNEFSQVILGSELVSPYLQAEDRRSKKQGSKDVSAGAKDESYHKQHVFSNLPMNSAAAQKRRFLSRSTSAASDSRGTPPTSRFDPQAPPSGKRRQLNNTHFLLASDPEDSDYDPRRRRSSVSPPPNRDRRSVGKAHFRIPTPEWEKSDWEGFPSSSPQGSAFPMIATRGQGIKRRGRSGPSVPYSEQHPPRRRRTVALSSDEDDEELREELSRAKKGQGKRDKDVDGDFAAAVTAATALATTTKLEQLADPQQPKGIANPPDTRLETPATTIKTEPPTELSTSAATFQTHVEEASKRDAARHENMMRRMAELSNLQTKED